MATAMDAELVAESRGRERFAPSMPHDMWQADGTLVRYRLASLAVIRQTDRDDRVMFLSDLRDLGRSSLPATQLIAHLLSHFSPHLSQPRSDAKDPVLEEVALPEKLKSYTSDLSAIGAFARPNQLMSNYISRELVRGGRKTPIYTPFIATDLAEAPGPAPTAEHTATHTRWKGLRQ